jgi:hypothetical protein
LMTKLVVWVKQKIGSVKFWVIFWIKLQLLNYSQFFISRN